MLAAGAFALLAGRGRLDLSSLILILATVLFSQIAIAVFNDICDERLDSVAQRERALPRGLISLRAATVVVAVSCVTCLLLSARLGTASLLMVAVGTGAGLAYSLIFKRTMWSWVPFAVAFPLLPTWIITSTDANVPHLWTLFLVGVPVAVAIHLADSIPDVDSDRRSASGGIAVALESRVL